jgi:hypothetical protein
MCEEIGVTVRVKINQEGDKIHQFSMRDPNCLKRLPDHNKILFMDGHMKGQIAGIRFRDADGGWGTTNLWRSVEFDKPFPGLALAIWASERPIAGCQHVIISPTKELKLINNFVNEEYPKLHKYTLRDDGYHLVNEC